jgi:hypothetical protein
MIRAALSMPERSRLTRQWDRDAPPLAALRDAAFRLEFVVDFRRAACAIRAY